MTWPSYTDFFRAATRRRETDPPIDPFPYQTRLAEEPSPPLLHIPTGAGKTAAAVLSWVWRRRFHADPAVRQETPRRLVYCLPMRILVEQTLSVVETYLKNLGLAEEIGLHQLLGGDADDDWTRYPEKEAILVGTQDMLLSRALNRGYGLSRFRWPQPFGLLHSDSLWVFDEVQLFGAGLPTTVQLEAFRQRFGHFGPGRSLWMSATLQPAWLETVDRPAPGPADLLRLTDDDLTHTPLRTRLHAPKQAVGLSLPGGVKDAAALAAAVSEQHRPESMTLVVLNTVDRAVALYDNLVRRFKASPTAPDLLLLHSRYRPGERRERVARLTQSLPAAGRIVIATQVVEAGVDISARVLFTELAPWPSVVQRLGRCNRQGEYDHATVFWMDLGEKEQAPYEAAELTASRLILRGLENRSVAPAALPDPTIRVEAWDVLRAADLRDLFDTSPDLSGNDIDVSRFIREQNDLDVQLFWRQWEGEQPDAEEKGPHRDELCPAPIGTVRQFLEKGKKKAWRWEHLTGRWRAISRSELRPGISLMLRAVDGGYSAETGWDPGCKQAVTVVDKRGEEGETPGGDRSSIGTPHWQSLTDHTEQVVAQLQAILAQLDHPDLAGHRASLLQAARWHDAGKAHPIFQQTMLARLTEAERERLAATIWAKSTGQARHSRRYFRHELASALAFLQHERALPEHARSLTAYLIAAHHGKVRLSIRALPKEGRPRGEGYAPNARYALGIWEGDPPLAAADLGGGTAMPQTSLSLGVMELGRGPDGEPSWLERTLALRDDGELGPFRLAYLEALLRAADARASAVAQEGVSG